jgi:hypothetical protein
MDYKNDTVNTEFGQSILWELTRMGNRSINDDTEVNASVIGIPDGNALTIPVTARKYTRRIAGYNYHSINAESMNLALLILLNACVGREKAMEKIHESQQFGHFVINYLTKMEAYYDRKLFKYRTTCESAIMLAEISYMLTCEYLETCHYKTVRGLNRADIEDAMFMAETGIIDVYDKIGYESPIRGYIQHKRLNRNIVRDEDVPMFKRFPVFGLEPITLGEINKDEFN